MTKKKENEESVTHPQYGERFEITTGGVTYYYWLKVTRTTLTIRETETATVLHQVPLSQIGIKTRGGRFVQKKDTRGQLIAGYVMAWMFKHWSQTRQ